MRAIFRVKNFATLEQAKALADAYILSNFRYCPAIWMFSCTYTEHSTFSE